jgi:hypothetical protein
MLISQRARCQKTSRSCMTAETCHGTPRWIWTGQKLASVFPYPMVPPHCRVRRAMSGFGQPNLSTIQATHPKRKGRTTTSAFRGRHATTGKKARKPLSPRIPQHDRSQVNCQAFATPAAAGWQGSQRGGCLRRTITGRHRRATGTNGGCCRGILWAMFRCLRHKPPNDCESTRDTTGNLPEIPRSLAWIRLRTACRWGWFSQRPLCLP